MKREELRRWIEAQAEPDFQAFSAALVPGADNMAGVRLPILKAKAREIARQADWRAFVEQGAQGEDLWFEETMLRGMVIGCASMELEERLERMAAFVPQIRNWSVCDSFCAAQKWVGRHREAVWDFLQPYIRSDEEFSVRFAAVMLLDHLITGDYIGRVLEALDSMSPAGYYAQMAIAWAVSIAYVKFPEETGSYLRRCRLDDFTYNKTLQKAVESRRVSDEDKVRLRAMKRKG